MKNLGKMRFFYLTLSLILLLNCNSGKNTSLKMTSFSIIDKRDFEVCFNENIEGKKYSITILTKSGRSIRKEGPLVVPKAELESYCFKGQKMQYSFRAYDEVTIKFYEDSIVNEKIDLIKWEVFTTNYKKPIASGEYNM